MDSPQRHRQPYIEPLRFGGNILIPPPPVNPIIGDDPFALPIGPQQVQNLPQGQDQGQLIHVSLFLF